MSLHPYLDKSLHAARNDREDYTQTEDVTDVTSVDRFLLPLKISWSKSLNSFNQHPSPRKE